MEPPVFCGQDLRGGDGVGGVPGVPQTPSTFVQEDVVSLVVFVPWDPKNPMSIDKPREDKTIVTLL